MKKLNLIPKPSLIMVFARKLGKTTIRKVLLIKWRHLRKKKIGPEKVAHVLAVKNPEYIKIAEVAINSFIFHNPESSVVLHCDKATSELAKSTFRQLIKRRQISIEELRDADQDWQRLKLNLLQYISRQERNFYMDCDVRWNGRLNLSNNCAYFVEEFSLSEKYPYKELLSLLNLSQNGFTMCNTTFVYLFPGNFTKTELNLLLSYQNSILLACEEKTFSGEDVTQLKRLSEQLAFSIFVKLSGKHFVPLKKKDGHMDGSFLESSYFGATGIKF